MSLHICVVSSFVSQYSTQWRNSCACTLTHARACLPAYLPYLPYPYPYPPPPHDALALYRRMLSGEIKRELIDVITPMVELHQRARSQVTDDIVRTFMTARKLSLER